MQEPEQQGGVLPAVRRREDCERVEGQHHKAVGQEDPRVHQGESFCGEIMKIN